MDSNGVKSPESKTIKGSIPQLKKAKLKNTLYKKEIQHTTLEKPALRGFMSVPFDGPISDEILFTNEEPRAVPWSVPWADVMMTLFVIFAALYVFKSPIMEEVVNHQEVRTEYVERAKTIPQGIADAQFHGKKSIQDIYDLSMQKLSSVSSIELVPDKAVRIILMSDLLFDLGEANIKEDAKASLREVAEVLRQTEYMVNVAGHTDDLPISTTEFPSNWELSTARAVQVARFLMKDMDIPEEKFYVTGHALYQPVKPNSSDMNRAANRRVEIIITKERPRGANEEVQQE
jgi:chemotaxis protein MotB